MQKVAPDNARQGRKGRAVLYVLGASLTLGLVALAAVAMTTPGA